MALTRGAFRTYDFDRMIVSFTMMDDQTEIACAVTTAAMDNLEKPFKATAAQREAQFLRLRDRIENRAAQKYLDASAARARPEIVLRSNDF
jgi:Protein of unknown function (DUF1488)